MFNITKTKTTYPVTLSEVKTHLRVDTNNFEDDDYIENYIIKSATRFCENFIDKDIALTTNTYTVYDFGSSNLRIDEGNLVSITDVSINGTLNTSYELYKENNQFTLEWENFLGGGEDPDYTLTTHFTTGYDGITNICPEDIKQAIFIVCGNLYDNERSSYSFSSVKKSDVVERILGPYRAIRW